MKTRPTNTNMGQIAGKWNLLFCKTSEKIKTIRRVIHQNLSLSPKGKGNKAWKRYEQLTKETWTGLGYRLAP
jgi:hypothetical protein